MRLQAPFFQISIAACLVIAVATTSMVTLMALFRPFLLENVHYPSHVTDVSLLVTHYFQGKRKHGVHRGRRCFPTVLSVLPMQSICMFSPDGSFDA